MPLRMLGGATKVDIGRLGEHIFYLATEDLLDPAATEFNAVNAARFHDGAAAVEPNWRALEADVRQRIPVNITVIRADVVLAAGGPGVGSSYTFTLRDSGIDTAVTITISGIVPGGSTGWINVNLLAGFLAWKCVPTNVPNAQPCCIMLWFRRNF